MGGALGSVIYHAATRTTHKPVVVETRKVTLSTACFSTFAKLEDDDLDLDEAQSVRRKRRNLRSRFTDQASLPRGTRRAPSRQIASRS